MPISKTEFRPKIFANLLLKLLLIDETFPQLMFVWVVYDVGTIENFKFSYNFSNFHTFFKFSYNLKNVSILVLCLSSRLRTLPQRPLHRIQKAKMGKQPTSNNGN